jgi:hypothetical protein
MLPPVSGRPTPSIPEKVSGFPDPFHRPCFCRKSIRLTILLALGLLSHRQVAIGEDADAETAPPPIIEVDHIGSPWWLATCRTMSREEQMAEALKLSRRLGMSARVCAVDLLSELKSEEARSKLTELLDDPDVIVRRLSAEALWGQDALKPERAAKYRYSEALTAERQAMEIFARIAEANRFDQYYLTRRIIDLKRPCLFELRRQMHSKNETLEWSARYVAQEIAAVVRNVEPVWAQEIRKKLTQKVTFRFIDKPLPDVLKEVSVNYGVPIRTDEHLLQKLWEHKEWPKITLGVEELKLSDALRWIMSLSGCDYGLVDGTILVDVKACVDGSEPIIMDVRDLEAAGYKPDWVKLLKSEGEKSDFWYLWYPHEPELNAYGFVIFEAAWSLGWSGRDRAECVANFMNNLRREQKLQVLPWLQPTSHQE